MNKAMTIKANEAPAHIRKMANTYLRSLRGYRGSRATYIICATTGVDKIRFVGRTEHGYRKITTGEYVPLAYLRNFGWKNTYYQCAEVTISIPIEFWA